MSDFYRFASDNPILTFLLVSTVCTMLVSTVPRLLPWTRRGDQDEVDHDED